MVYEELSLVKKIRKKSVELNRKRWERRAIIRQNASELPTSVMIEPDFSENIIL